MRGEWRHFSRYRYRVATSTEVVQAIKKAFPFSAGKRARARHCIGYLGFTRVHSVTKGKRYIITYLVPCHQQHPRDLLPSTQDTEVPGSSMYLKKKKPGSHPPRIVLPKAGWGVAGWGVAEIATLHHIRTLHRILSMY